MVSLVTVVTCDTLVRTLPYLTETDAGMESVEHCQRHGNVSDNCPSPNSIETSNKKNKVFNNHYYVLLRI